MISAQWLKVGMGVEAAVRAGVTTLDAADAGPVPVALVALTVHV